eukprot:m.375736 g.375736  ORF g.375736 m.375736 type:complete len:399 (-) comp20011_c0_seq13:1080-2276(-)
MAVLADVAAALQEALPTLFDGPAVQRPLAHVLSHVIDGKDTGGQGLGAVRHVLLDLPLPSVAELLSNDLPLVAQHSIQHNTQARFLELLTPLLNEVLDDQFSPEVDALHALAWLLCTFAVGATVRNTLLFNCLFASSTVTVGKAVSLAISLEARACLDCAAAWMAQQSVEDALHVTNTLWEDHAVLARLASPFANLATLSPALAHEVLCSLCSAEGPEARAVLVAGSWLAQAPAIALRGSAVTPSTETAARSDRQLFGQLASLSVLLPVTNPDADTATGARLHAALVQALFQPAQATRPTIHHQAILETVSRLAAVAAAPERVAGGMPDGTHATSLLMQSRAAAVERAKDRLAQLLQLSCANGLIGGNAAGIAASLAQLQPMTKLLHAVAVQLSGTTT